eukprot:GILK01007589.1.p1 GENE.GILK01007589.1~~GILK01007589.1.p1  ORF type:complete len:990 (-),score=185.29 GILK01007589.1:398-3367(-)
MGMGGGDQDIRQIMDLGFSEQDAQMALKQFPNVEQAIDWLLTRGQLPIPYAVAATPMEGVQKTTSGRTKEEEDLQRALAESMRDSAPSAVPAGQLLPSREDEEVSKAIEASMMDQTSQGIDMHTFEPLNPHERKRVSDLPVGLKNVGNTCYVNSLFQTYFKLPHIRHAVLSFRAPSDEKLKEEVSAAQDDELKKSLVLRRHASIKLVKELQMLFACMMYGTRKYGNPTSVLKALVDDTGRPIQIGDQKDVGEFNLNFLDRLDEGLQAGEHDDLDENQYVVVREAPSDMAVDGTPVATDTKSKDGLVKRSFFGEMTEVRSAPESDGSVCTQESTVEFGQINLNLGHGDVYSSWDSFNHTTLDGYITPGGNVTTARSDCWLKSIPPVLLLQLQRVSYDAEKQSLVKLHDRFTFEKTLFIDRFLESNKAEASLLRERLEALRVEHKELEDAFNRFKDYDGSHASLDDILRKAGSFFQTQLVPSGVPAVSAHPHPSRIGLLGKPVHSVESAINIIRDYLTVVSCEMTMLNSKLAGLKQTMDSIFSHMQNKPYQLHSVLVHDGVAGSGHYWAFIFDKDKSTWHRYNDAHVSEVNEETVWKESVGGYANMSAYCLIYVDPSWHPAIMDKQESSVTTELMSKVEADSQKLEEEIRQYDEAQEKKRLAELEKESKQLEQRASTFLNKVLERTATAKQQAKGDHPCFALGEVSDARLINFAVFLLKVNKEPLMEYFVADTTYRELTGEQRSLAQAPRNAPWMEKLDKLLASSPSQIMFEPTSAEEYADKQQTYTMIVQEGQLLLHGLHALCNQQLDVALRYFCYALSLPLPPLFSHAKELHNNAQLTLVELTEFSLRCYQQGTVRDALTAASMAVTFANALLPRDQPLFHRIAQDLVEVLESIQQSPTAPEDLQAEAAQVTLTLTCPAEPFPADTNIAQRLGLPPLDPFHVDFTKYEEGTKEGSLFVSLANARRHANPMLENIAARVRAPASPVVPSL